MQYMNDFADRLRDTGEYVSTRRWRWTGCGCATTAKGKPPVTDGPFAETKDLVAGWMMIDVDSYDRALELAAELSAAPGAGVRPIERVARAAARHGGGARHHRIARWRRWMLRVA